MRRLVGAVLAVACVAASSIVNAPVAKAAISPPGAPTGVSASAGTLSATVRWTPTGEIATSFTVVSNPGGISATVAGTAITATVTGLGFGLAYDFTVTGTNSGGAGSPSSASNFVTPLPPGSPYHPGVNVPLINRDITAGQPLATNLGDDPVHFRGLSGLVLNVTASLATAATTVQLVLNQQVVQSIPVVPGQQASSLVMLGVPAQFTQGAVQVTAGRAHVELDFVGYFSAPSTLRDHSGMLQPLQTATLFNASIAAGGSTDLTVLGQEGVPSAHVAAVLVNVTASGATAAGALTLSPAGSFATGATTVGFGSGQTTANRAIVALPSTGAIRVADRAASATAKVEVLGWFTDGTDATAIGSLYTPLAPARLVDTTANGGPLLAGDTLSFGVWGNGGAPPGSSIAPPTSAVLQVTAVNPSGAGSIAISGANVVDFTSGATASSIDVVQLASDGSSAVSVLGSNTNVTVDLVGYLAGDLIVPGTTKKLPASLLAGITSLTDTSITFGPVVQASPPINLNDVINAGVSPTTPFGFLRRVLAISTSSIGETVVTTRNASLPEALTAYSINWSEPPRTGVFGMRQSARSNATASLPPFQPPPGTSIDPNWPVLTLAGKGHQLVFPISASFSSLSGELNVTDLELQLVPHVAMGNSPFTNPQFAFALSMGMRFQADASILGTIASATWTPFDHDFTTKPPEVIPAGPIDIIVQGLIEPRVTVDLTLQAGVQVTIKADKYSIFTGGYNGGFFGNSQSFDYVPSDQTITNPVPTLQAEFRPGLHFIGGLLFYGFAKVAGDRNPYFRFTVDPLGNPWWEAALGMCGHLIIGIDFTQFLINLRKEATIDFPCEEIITAQAPGPFINITITPSPASVARSGTQHFTATTNPITTGVLWSVVDANGGTLSNVTLTSVDYTAPARAGKYQVQATSLVDPTSTRVVEITVTAVAPSTPTSVAAALSGSTAATVTWAAPVDDGGAPITDYTVLSSDGTLMDAGTSTFATFSGLAPGTAYTFTVTATNSAGLTSAPSPPSPPITTPPAGPMSIVPTAINFGTVALGRSSSPQAVLVTAGGNPLAISSVAISGTNPGEFGIQSDTCSGHTIQPGNSCTFSVGYTPTLQINASAVVSIADDDPTSVQTVTLTGSSPVQAISGVVPVRDIQMIDSQTGYAIEASLGSLLLKTTDGGKTWNRLFLPAPDQVNISFDGYNLRFIDAMHGFVGAYRSLQPSGRMTFILSTSDGGQTWQQINLPSGVGLGTFWFSDSLHGWMVTGVAGPPPPPGSIVNSTLAALYATTDGGLTWSLQSLPDPVIAGTPGCIGDEGNITARFADASNGWVSGVALCFAPNGTITTQGVLVWTTNDGGTSWTAHQLPAGVVSIYDRIQVTGMSQMRQPGVLMISSTSVEQVLIASDDGGATFTVTPLPVQNTQNVQTAAVTFSDSSHGVLLTTDGQVWRTSDAGATWQGGPLPRFVSSTGRITSYGYGAIDSPDGTKIWVTGDVFYGFNLAGFIEYSADGGATWTVQLLGSGT